MPRHHFKMCRSPLHADDTHTECVSCLGKSHTDATLSGTDCSHCESFSLASLRSWIAFFSESDSAPHALTYSSSQGPVRKKQWGREFEQPVKRTSELTSAQCPHASPSPQREHLPVLFTQHNQRPSAAASDMISFGASDNELDDSLSLVASDTEELSGSVADPAPSYRRLLHATPELLPDSKSWCAPYWSHICPSASAALTSVDGAEEKGYEHLSPLDESVAAHLCLSTAIGWKARASLSHKNGSLTTD